ncbi:DUF3530 family protein [Marinobacter halophilus]|uniref:DUF3530 domain-containing protein n=1 Tax=Marinobacter halophilus TaxID=1323740 RepID=A0A2T1KF65_9GAMM|nr:DUF3530 family protein [Marinobacter halophilus]PSF08755.1 DUF3530 domain-containing protein [Marinobacter halophilus]GGC63543.1 hypothetical protein GCM10011362_09880 [Marinobacter halophilus]
MDFRSVRYTELIRSRAKIWVCWLVLAGLSVNAQAQEEDQPEPDMANERVAERRAMSMTGLGEWALAKAYPERAVWLDLEDDGRALALFQPELKTPGRGAVIVLANEGQTAAEGLSGPLLQALAERGFAVMTLGLRPPPQSLVRRRQQPGVPEPRRLEGADDDDDQASVMIDVAEDDALQELLADYRNAVRELLDAAAEDMERRGYEQPAVAGIGWSADYVTGWAVGRNSLAGVIWLAPRFPTDRLAALPEMLAADRPWQVLDLHSAHGKARSQGVARAADLGRQQVAGYQRQSIALAGPPQPSDADRLASRISAWLGR